MDRLPTEGLGRTHPARRAADPLTGFGAARQTCGVWACGASLALHGILVAVSVLMLGLAAPGQLEAQSVRDPIVPGIRPQPRPVPTPRISPRPQFLPAPRAAPGPARPSGPAVGGNPAIVRPATPGPNCHARCGSQCQTVSCSGLNATQCAKARQQCRMSCRSQCRS